MNYQICIILLLIVIVYSLNADLMDSYSIGSFNVKFNDVTINPFIEITNNNKIVFQTVSNDPFLRLGNGSLSEPPIMNGNYQIHETTNYLTKYLSIYSINQIEQSSLLINGQIYNNIDTYINKYNYSLLFTTINDNTLYFNLSIDLTKYLTNNLSTYQSINHTNYRLYFYYTAYPSELFYGFGESFSYFNLKGLRVPIVVSEQGVGRGVEPVTSYYNNNVSEGSGGYWFTTYAPKPCYITNMNRSVFVDKNEVMFINLTNDQIVEIEIWAVDIQGYIFYGESWLSLLKSLTSILGRQPSDLPVWTQEGAIVGLEGGTENVTKIIDKLLDFQFPIAGIWLQDWVGLRHNYDGDRLIWNWELNSNYYPNWYNLISNLNDLNIKILTYISPFFSNPTNYSTTSHNFFIEGINNNYFIKHNDPNNYLTNYLMHSLSIDFYMLDVTNPLAVDWMIDVIVNYTYIQANSSGFMCDFGEYLPFDSIAYDQQTGFTLHNIYPYKWAEIARRSIDRYNYLFNKSTNDIFYFVRSAWSRSPSVTPVFWLGDQLVSWDSSDGIKSVLTGALSSGLSGQTITHSDIGGYNSIFTLGSSLYYVRTPELLKRWSEFAAFGSAIYRTHIGSSTNPINAQIYDTNDSILHFAEFAYIFKNLSTYRQSLIYEATTYGYPLMRPLALHYFYDQQIWSDDFNANNIQLEYLFGEDFIIKPTLDKDSNFSTVYLPSYSGSWVHLWSGKIFTTTSQGVTMSDIPSSIGFPCVFYKQSSNYGMQLRAFVIEKGFTTNYQWVDSHVDSDDSSNSNNSLLFILFIIISGVVGISVISFILIYNRQSKPLTRDEIDKKTGIYSILRTDESSENIQ